MQKVNVPKAIVVRISGFRHLAGFITFGVTNEFLSSDYYMLYKREKGAVDCRDKEEMDSYEH